MKILHVQAGDLTGGAARSVYWLHLALKDLMVDSNLLITTMDREEQNIIKLVKNKQDRLRQIILNQFDGILLKLYKNRKGMLFSPAFFGNDITKLKEYAEADILHFHWVNNANIGIKLFSKIKKPIVWTFRDMWPFTGGCHYAIECQRYEMTCGKCPVLKSDWEVDLSRWIIKRKIKHFGKHIYPIAISSWLKDCAKKSNLFKDFNINIIHNGVNTELFKPVNKSLAREILNLPNDKKIILAGAHNAQDFYKGFSKYLDTLEILGNKKDYFFLFFGRLDEEAINKFNISYRSLGFLKDNASLVLTYSSADVFVAPSLQEAFGKTLIEAMACSTPVVCFDATGPKDIVDHKVDGYRAEAFEVKDLANGIEWVLNNETSQLGDNARSKVIEKFDIKKVAQKYLELYKKIYLNKI
jgi:glycosyltransferase involved in cell wall biosynthesis